MSFDNKKLSSFQFRGLELSCIVSDILFSNTECIGAICDSNFHLTFGLARAIKDAAGDDFLAKLQQERRKQSSSAIAVHVIRTRALQTNYVILCPARRSIRDSFDEIYYEFFNKAKDLQLQSMTLPLLGTGYYGLSFDLATQFLKKAFTQFSNFGSLKKIYFIDQSKKPMDKLRDFFDSQMSSNVNENPSNSLHSGRNKINISALSDSSGSSIFGSSSSSYNTASNDFIDFDVSVSANDESEPSVHHNIRINSSNVTINLYMSEDDSDDDNDSDVNDDMDDDNDVEEDSFISDGDMASLPSSISDSSLSDVSISLNNSDLEDSADGGSDDDSDIADPYPDSSDSEHETNNLQNHLIDEEVFWNSVSVQNLTCSPQKPTTSSNSHQMGVNLDDSTIPCSICLCDMRDNSENAGSSVVQLSLCSHMFHLECIRAAFNVKKQCPLCMCWYKDPIGYQPKDAKMTVRQIPGHVPGHKSAKGFHEIIYHIPAGIQIYGHIRPGRPYRSMTRIAYLPNNKEGTLVLKLLQLAFKRRLIFTIGDSLTTGRKDVPIWNGIHHKTNKGGGPQCYGYPDPDYLSRVKEELAAVGVRIDQLEN